MSLLELKNITKMYKDKSVLDNFSETMERGERIAIIGHSGCGKTTLLRIISGLIPPYEGELKINGKIVSGNGKVIVPPYKRNISMVFQDLALWPHLSVEENINFGLSIKIKNKNEIKRKTEEIAKQVGIENKLKEKPSTLSGGEKQRVALARALISNPDILLMDEPLSSLDTMLKLKILETILSLQRERRFLLIFVSHQFHEALTIGERFIIMEKGRVIKRGNRKEVKAYLESIEKRFKIETEKLSGGEK